MAGAAPPRRPALRLVDLAPVDASDVAAHDDRASERIAGEGVARLDWARATLRACEVALVAVRQLHLDGGRIVDSRIVEPDITTLRARDSSWRTVEISGGRLPSVDAPGSTWDTVAVTRARLGYVNLRDCTLSDIALVGCRIETLDLSGATALRVSLDDCVVDELVVTRATLRDVDLRGARVGRIDGLAHLAGATISADQLLDLAPALAGELGITVGG